MDRKELVKGVRKVVVKMGTAALSNEEGGLDETQVARLAGQIHALELETALPGGHEQDGLEVSAGGGQGGEEVPGHEVEGVQRLQEEQAQGEGHSSGQERNRAPGRVPGHGRHGHPGESDSG